MRDLIRSALVKIATTEQIPLASVPAERVVGLVKGATVDAVIAEREALVLAGADTAQSGKSFADRHASTGATASFGGRALASSPALLGVARHAIDVPARRAVTYSTTEVGVFGIGPAGWVPLGEAHHGKTQYGWDRSPLRAGEAAYDLGAMLDTSWRKAPLAERARLIEGYVESVTLDPPDAPQKRTIADQLRAGTDATTILTGLLGADDNHLRYFSQYVRDTTTDDGLRAQARKVHDIASHSDATEVARYDSKKALVDLLQANVGRYYAGEPLIPVYLALRKRGVDAPSSFVPDLAGTRDKSTAFTTDREIRMIYKLTEELPNAELRDIARKTFFFVEQDATDEAHRTFSNLPNPWDALTPEQLGRSTAPTDNFAPNGTALWAARTRSGGRAAYHARAAADVPTWVTKLEAVQRAARGD